MKLFVLSRVCHGHFYTIIVIQKIILHVWNSDAVHETFCKFQSSVMVVSLPLWSFRNFIFVFR